MKLEFTDCLDWPARKTPGPGSSYLCLLSTGIWTFYVGARDLNSAPHDCMASILLIGPSSQPC